MDVAIGVAGYPKVYEFLSDLHDAPATIMRLSNELSELTSCFTALRSRTLDATTREALAELNLPQIISRCGTTCTKLQADLSHWAKSGQEHLYTRLRFRLNRSRIQGVTEQITVAKQTLTFAVTISIRYLLKKPPFCRFVAKTPSIQQDRILSTMADTNIADQREEQRMRSGCSSSGNQVNRRSFAMGSSVAESAEEQDTQMVQRPMRSLLPERVSTQDTDLRLIMMTMADRTSTQGPDANRASTTASNTGSRAAGEQQDIGDTDVVDSKEFTIGAPDGSFAKQSVGKTKLNKAKNFHIGTWKSDK